MRVPISTSDFWDDDPPDRCWSQVLSSHGRPVDLQPPFTPFVVLAWVVLIFFFPFRGDIGVRTLGRGWLGRRVKGGMRLEMTKDMSAWKGGSLSAKRMKTPED